jgi:hypothetical protein
MCWERAFGAKRYPSGESGESRTRTVGWLGGFLHGDLDMARHERDRQRERSWRGHIERLDGQRLLRSREKLRKHGSILAQWRELKVETLDAEKGKKYGSAIDLLGSKDCSKR